MINDLEMMTVDTDEHSYFLCANSGFGFVNYIPEVIPKYNKRILIKGGPGTGKSFLMKKIIEKAEEYGYLCDKIYCSSDSSSLDGVLIDKMSLAILDATAPHISEPEYPGISDVTFDLSRFWDEKVLFQNKDDIIFLNGEKTKCYNRSYLLLNSFLLYQKLYYSVLSECVNEYSLTDSIERLTLNSIREDNPTFGKKLCSSVSSKGFIKFGTYEAIISKQITFNDKTDASQIFLNTLFAQLKDKRISCVYSPDVIDTNFVEAINIPSLNITICKNSIISSENIIDSDEFLIKEKYKQNKERLKRLKRLMLKTATEISYQMSFIADFHSALESKYTSAMDFDKKEKAQNELIDKIFQ